MSADTTPTSRYLFILAGLIICLSVVVFLFNHYKYHFPANNYFPKNALQMVINLLLIYLGLNISLLKSTQISAIRLVSGTTFELLCFCGVMSTIALATNAVQLTPFAPIDQQIVALEAYLHIDLHSVLIWTGNHPYFKMTLAFIYASLGYQMSLIPVFLILCGRYKLLREYYFLLLFSLLIGFSIYFFFPTTAPASVIESPLFFNSQVATGVKFNQIHQHIIPTTNEGGLISLPSFHTIWALLCVFLLKEWPFFCLALLMVNTLLIASCFLLGWHYASDLLGAFIIVGISYYFLLLTRRQGCVYEASG